MQQLLKSLFQAYLAAVLQATAKPDIMTTPLACLQGTSSRCIPLQSAQPCYHGACWNSPRCVAAYCLSKPHMLHDKSLLDGCASPRALLSNCRLVCGSD